MTPAPGRSQPKKGGRRPARRPQKPLDLWRPVPPLPPVEPIVPAGEATVLLRSLGDPPLPGESAYHLALVVERAAGLATALAASADLLALSAEPSD